jgi:hypothetical protein
MARQHAVGLRAAAPDPASPPPPLFLDPIPFTNAGRSRCPAPAALIQVAETVSPGSQVVSLAFNGTVTLPLALSATWLAPNNATTDCSSAFPTQEVSQHVGDPGSWSPARWQERLQDSTASHLLLQYIWIHCWSIDIPCDSCDMFSDEPPPPLLLLALRMTLLVCCCVAAGLSRLQQHPVWPGGGGHGTDAAGGDGSGAVV